MARKKMKKVLLGGISIVLIIVVAGGILLARNINRIVRLGTEKALSYALQVDVSVGAAKVNITESSVAFDNIVIDNPDGYKTDRAIRIGHVETQVDIASFRTDAPTIRDIQLTGAEITMEIKGRDSNLADLLKNAERLAGSAEAAPAPKEEASGKAFKIDRIHLGSNEIRLSFPLMEGRTANLSLPDMELTDLGGQKGATPAQALADFLKALIDKIRTLSLNQLPSDLINPFKDSLQGIGGQLKEDLGNAQQQLEGTASKLREGVEQNTEDVKEGLKGLLNR